MTDENTILNTDTILNLIQEMFTSDDKKGPFCSEEEFRYYFLSKVNATINGNNNYSLEYPFKYKKNRDDDIKKDNAKVDAILWDQKDPNHGLCAFEFKYAHEELKSHGKTIKGQTQTINVRYDFLEDIDRLESLFDDNSDIHVDTGYAIFLTNKQQYMADPGQEAIYYNIRLTKGRTFDKNTPYSCTRQDDKVVDRQYYHDLIFRSDYTIEWKPIGDTGGFWCCIVEVKPLKANN